MAQIDPLLHQRVAKIRVLALDVDGVLTDGQLYFDNHGNELKAFHSRDGLGIKSLLSCGIEVSVITSRSSEIVERRCASLGVGRVYQGAERKLDAYVDLLARTRCDDEEVCYMGDDWLDLPLLRRVGLAVTVPEADRRVRNSAHWITGRAGGRGAVRELCDLILEVQGHAERLIEDMLDR